MQKAKVIRGDHPIRGTACATRRKKAQLAYRASLYECLVEAAVKGDARQVKKLLAVGAEVDADGELSDCFPLDDLVDTPLGAAAGAGHLPVVKVLLAAGADIERRGGYPTLPPISHAASQGHIDVVRYLVDQGADLENPGYAGYYDCANGPPLLQAACCGQLDVVSYLLDRGVDVDGCDCEGMTALDWAFKVGYPAVANFIAGFPARREANALAARAPGKLRRATAAI